MRFEPLATGISGYFFTKRIVGMDIHIALKARDMQIGADRSPMDRAMIFGASRGFGAGLAKHISSRRYPVVGFGRKVAPLQALRESHPLFEYRVADLAPRHGQDEAIRY